MAYRDDLRNMFQARRADRNKYELASTINGIQTTYKAMREARLQHERDLQMFELNKRVLKTKVALMESDPDFDPVFVQQKKKLSLAKLKSDEAELNLKTGRMNYQQKPLEDKMKIMLPRMLQMGEALNKATEANPAIFGDLLIDVDLQKGQINLKSRTDKKRADEFDLDKLTDLYSTIQKNKIQGDESKSELEQSIEEAILSRIGSAKVNDQEFDKNTESIIQSNMAAYKKSREEVVGALRKKGIIK